MLIYAFFKPKRRLKKRERELKEKSRGIVSKIDDGEEVVTSVVHLSEVANVLSTCFSPQDLTDLLETLYSKGNFTLFDVSAKEYLLAVQISREMEVGVNDCLAYHLMDKNDLEEIYTFDSDFEEFDLKILQA